MISPLVKILSDYGVLVEFRGDEILIVDNRSNYQTGITSNSELKLIVYPSMLVKPRREGAIFVSDFETTFSRAYTVDNIKGALGC
jgi:hypothetical protein